MAMMSKLPFPVKMLLAVSLMLTAGRAVTLPVIAVYLVRALSLQPSAVGYILTASLTLGTLSSLYGGYVADRADRRMLLAGGIGACALSYLEFPGVGSGWVALLLLTLQYSTASLLEVAGKAYIAALMAPQERVKVFSLRYTLNNVGFAVGPLVGAWLATRSETALFRLSGGLTLACLLLLVPAWRALGAPRAEGAAPLRSFGATIDAMRSDRRLVMFTLAGTLAAVVYARFSAYLSQYLAVVVDTATAYETVAYAITVNALVVVALQYLVGSRITVANLRRSIAIGLLLFAAGLTGFALSTATWAWMAAMVVFSAGEVVVIPATYLFIDSIAPDHMKGSYYGAQSLSNLGGAASPALCGLLLSASDPRLMFCALIAMAIAALWLFHAGSGRRDAAFVAAADAVSD
jgi:MFS family permease